VSYIQQVPIGAEPRVAPWPFADASGTAVGPFRDGSRATCAFNGKIQATSLRNQRGRLRQQHRQRIQRQQRRDEAHYGFCVVRPKQLGAEPASRDAWIRACRSDYVAQPLSSTHIHCASLRVMVSTTEG
jgi:hypothetical protein